MGATGKPPIISDMDKINSFINNAKEKGMIFGTETMQVIMERLENPQNKLKNIIHIVGTNGKGSVGAFIEKALIDKGFNVGRYSSPAVFDRYETIRKNGKNISKSDYKKYAQQVMEADKEKKATVFEIETAVAILYMNDCDYCLIEAGLGGLSDATNIFDCKKTVILTSISLDHINILGSTVKEISKQKCGVFNDKTTVISANQTPEVIKVIRDEAKGLPLVFADIPENIRYKKSYQEFDYKDIKNIKINLLGEYQPQNAVLAYEALTSMGINENDIRKSFLNIVWNGRFEILKENPLIIADGAHNRDAFLQLKKTLEKYYPNEKFNFITGVLADKEHKLAVELLSPMADKVYTIQSDSPRALSKEAYAQEFKNCGVDAVPIDINDIPKHISNDKINIFFGSLSFMKEIKRILN